jgi:cytochrome c-type biogenesis protein CcmE
VSGRTYQLTGKVVAGYTRDGTVTDFRVRDRTGATSVPVRYTGVLPDPFRAGREVIVKVRKQGDMFVGEPDSLVTKCPSKFSAEAKKT